MLACLCVRQEATVVPVGELEDFHGSCVELLTARLCQASHLYSPAHSKPRLSDAVNSIPHPRDKQTSSQTWLSSKLAANS